MGGAGVPITLQTLGVALAGAILGPLRGSLAVLLYLAMGAIGLPVFAEHSAGLGAFTGVSAGYLLAFPLAAALIGYLVKYVLRDRRTSAFWVFLAIAAGSVLVVHPAGIAWMTFHQDVPWAVAASWDLPSGSAIWSRPPSPPSSPPRCTALFPLVEASLTCLSSSSRTRRSPCPTRPGHLGAHHASTHRVSGGHHRSQRFGQIHLARCSTTSVPTSGRVLVDGIDTARHPAEVRRKVGFCFSDPAAQWSCRPVWRHRTVAATQPP